MDDILKKLYLRIFILKNSMLILAVIALYKLFSTVNKKLLNYSIRRSF